MGSRALAIACCLALWGCGVAMPAAGGPVDSGARDSGLAPEPRVDAGGDAGETGADAGQDAGTPSVAVCPGDAGVSKLPACTACQRSHCCGTLGAVAANPEGATLWSCLNGCTTSGCRFDCYGQYPAAVWDVSGLVTCSQNDCATDCGLGTPTCGGIRLTSSTCDACVAMHCCAERTACGKNDQCDAFVYQCLDREQCPDVTGACAQQCRARHDAGVDAFDALRQCALGACASACTGL